MRYSGLSSCPCVCACLSYLWSLSAVCLTEKLMSLWVVESGEFAHAHILFHLFLVQSCSTFSKYLIIAQIRLLVLCFVVVNRSTFIWPSVSSLETQLVKFFFFLKLYMLLSRVPNTAQRITDCSRQERGVPSLIRISYS